MTDVTVEIGEMNTRITLQSPTITTGPDGAQIPGFTDVVSVWSAWDYHRGMEGVVSEAVQAEQGAIVRIRYYSAVQANWRVLKNGQAWLIVAPPEQIREKRRYTELHVRLVKGSI